MLSEADVNKDFLAFKGGKESGYKNLFRRFYKPLCLFAFQFKISKEESEEIVQDVLLKLWYKKNDFDTLAKLSSFLYVSTRNSTFNLLDKNKRLLHNQEIFFADSLSSPIVYDEQLRQIAYVETVEILHQAFSKLPTQCAKIMSLLYLEGYTVEEVVDLMNISPSTVYVQKKKGVDMLKNILKLDDYLLLALFLSFLFDNH